MNIEDELRAALRREDPSPGFYETCTARSVHKPAPKSSFPRILWAAGLAAMLVVGFMGTSEYRQIQAERAGRDAVLALRIAAEQLNMARDKIARREN